MKKVLSLVIAVVTFFAATMTGNFVNAATTSKFMPNRPSYEKVDPDFAKEAQEAGIKVTGKKLYSGKAYMKPGTVESLTPVDRKGFDHTGIAILVDFPETEPGKSEVPGVNYERIPEYQFDDLLNGDTYNPYKLPMFSHLTTYDAKDKDGNIIKTYTASTDRTMKNYFNEVSYNQFGIKVDVTDWITLPHNYNYYMGQNLGYYNDNGDAHIGELVSDAIDLAAKKGVDFSKYAIPAKAGDFTDVYGNATSFKDENGNVISQIVPNIFIIHRGTGAEYSEDPSIIWSHKWDILSANYFGKYYQTGSYPADSSLAYKVVDGVVVNTYDICPEVGQDITGYYTSQIGQALREPSPADVGVFAHEFSHVLGIPDQYDYGYDSMGTGMYSIMASGSYGRDIPNRYYSGFCPVDQDAWSKYYLGFVNPINLSLTNKKQQITLRPVSESKDIYKIVVPGSNGREYFLLENRQQTGFDKGLSYNPDGTAVHGLAVWHIDEDVLKRNFDRPNEAANWDWNGRGASYKDAETGENHYGVALVQADGKFDLEKNINDADAGDLFPGTSGAVKLSSNIKSTPNTISYYKWGLDNRGITGITLDNIKENADGTVTLNVYLAK